MPMLDSEWSKLLTIGVAVGGGLAVAPTAQNLAAQVTGRPAGDLVTTAVAILGVGLGAAAIGYAGHKALSYVGAVPKGHAA